MLKHIGMSIVIAVIGALCLEVGGQLLAPDQIGFVSTAQARIGRPLTPVSVAGVTRRTVRRCAAGVYYC